MNGMQAEVVVCGHKEDKVREAIYFFERFGFSAVGADGLESLKAALISSRAEAVVLLSDSKLETEDSMMLHVVGRNTNIADAAMAIRLHHEQERKVNGNPRPKG